MNNNFLVVGEKIFIEILREWEGNNDNEKWKKWNKVNGEYSRYFRNNCKFWSIFFKNTPQVLYLFFILKKHFLKKKHYPPSLKIVSKLIFDIKPKLNIECLIIFKNHLLNIFTYIINLVFKIFKFILYIWFSIQFV